MARLVADRFGGPDVLHVIRGEPLPEPGPREARVRVEAAGIGFTDTAVRRGKYLPYRKGTPFTPGYDIVGTVDQVGSDVSELKVGDRVADIPVVGGYASHIIRPAASLVTITRDLDPAIAVCVPLIWITAWQMLTRIRSLPKGSWVYVVGASGGVGTAMLEISRFLGLKVIGTCSPDRFAEVERRGGVPFDYQDPDLLAKIRSTSNGGVAAAFDAIGGESARIAYESIAANGLFVSYGAQSFTNGAAALPSVLRDIFRATIWWNRPTWLGGGPKPTMYLITSRRKSHPSHYAEDTQLLCNLLASTTLERPDVGRVGFSDVASIHAAIEEGKAMKKYVIVPD